MDSLRRPPAITVITVTGVIALSAAASALGANRSPRSVQSPEAVVAASTPGTSIRVRPRTVRAGKSVIVDGYVPGCPDAVSLLSRAFSGPGEFAGVPMITAAIQDEDGYFRKTTTISRSRRPGRYSITGRCGGGNIGARTTLRVLAPRS